MSDSSNWLQKLEKERADRMFASKRQACLLFAPCVIALAYAFLKIAIGVDSSDALVMASLLSLVCGSLGLLRARIINHETVIQQLQERLEKLEQASGSGE